ncbi:putative toxin-antitoxin system toxin component, PIN family [Hydrogenophaga taeniospiralis]|uniref:putative toxin-antitoxin system toxin component, PIN family n=1 Tax=Hydrogenophaga taeniospiralis TaxID=65656 RepID=UPI001CFC2F16|nr:putative toxin-antitoxin system toxin component, PIN family [Hydrogenophaga taeniospiralis]UCU95852.1 putative toxin-antitoxin system toxin component, PIN family [Hydrogenophaga taeniospiralis]
MRVEHQQLVVLDTNVWLSASLSPNGTPAQVVRVVLLQELAVFSEATFAELETRIWKPKFDRYISLEARKSILRDARAAALWVEIPPELAEQRWSRDADDDVFIRTALAANASWLVTGDDDLLSVSAIEGLNIVTPAQTLLAWTTT